MKQNVDRRLVEFISNNWDEPGKSEEVSDLIEAIVAELKQDYRNYQRSHSRVSDETQAYWEGLIGTVQDKSFWEYFEHLNNFSFDY